LKQNSNKGVLHDENKITFFYKGILVSAQMARFRIPDEASVILYDLITKPLVNIVKIDLDLIKHDICLIQDYVPKELRSKPIVFKKMQNSFRLFDIHRKNLVEKVHNVRDQRGFYEDTPKLTCESLLDLKKNIKVISDQKISASDIPKKVYVVEAKTLKEAFSSMIYIYYGARIAGLYRD